MLKNQNGQMKNRYFRITELNKLLTTKRMIINLSIAIFCIAMTVFLLPAIIKNDLNSPPEIGDAHDYDAIGLQLHKGNGFSFDWQDSEYRRPYLENNDDGKYDFLLNRKGQGLTTYRPPLLPAIIAVSHNFFGREFWPIRIANSAFMAIGCVIAFLTLAKYFGVIPGGIGALILLQDERIQEYASQIMTEALAVFLVSIISYLLLSVVKNKTYTSTIGLGVALGFAFLDRTVFILWVPVILASIYFLAKPDTAKWKSASAFGLPAIFIVSFLCISAPWMIRNSIVLGAVEPLGTMGSINLSAAYSDQAFTQRGAWYSLSEAGFFDSLNPEIQNKTAIEAEKIKAEYSRKKALEWIYENPGKTITIAYFKLRSLWKHDTMREKFYLLFTILGFLALLQFDKKFAVSMLIPIIACSCSVMMTWDVGGRFLVPIIPVLVIFSAVGVWRLIIMYLEPVMNRVDID